MQQLPGLTFGKMLGTAKPTTFTPGATDPRHWAALTVWQDAEAAASFGDSAIARSWALIAQETLTLTLQPLASHGQWSGQEPFAPTQTSRWDGPVAAITRARIDPRKMRAFWSASREVAGTLPSAPGLVMSTGIGEAPIGLQGTLSIWSSLQAMNDFAQRNATHREVIDATPTQGWYLEELFARFAVIDASGTFVGNHLSLADSGGTPA
jgi:hypothetical protein